ncbi:hypothetical protein [Candidatus Regiella insecticola]|nr:hypothetical protein [Candidatus Regiella insecticola]
MTIDPISSFAAVPGIVGLIGRFMPQADVNNTTQISKFNALLHAEKASEASASPMPPLALKEALTISANVAQLNNKVDWAAAAANKLVSAVNKVTSLQ